MKISDHIAIHKTNKPKKKKTNKKIKKKKEKKKESVNEGVGKQMGKRRYKRDEGALETSKVRLCQTKISLDLLNFVT